MWKPIKRIVASDAGLGAFPTHARAGLLQLTATECDRRGFGHSIHNRLFTEAKLARAYERFHQCDRYRRSTGIASRIMRLWWVSFIAL